MLFVKFFVLLLVCKCVFGNTLIIRNFTQCGQPMQYLTFTCKMKHDEQLCDITYKSPVTNGENFRLDAMVTWLRGKKWRNLFHIKEEKGLCYGLERYTKTLFYEAFDLANEPKKCPLRKAEIIVDKMRGKSWRNFIRKKDEKGPCHLLETFLRQTFYELLEAAGIPKRCPVAKGTYSVTDMNFHLDRIEMLSVVPNSRIRIKLKSYEKSSGKLGVCAVLEL